MHLPFVVGHLPLWFLAATKSKTHQNGSTKKSIFAKKSLAAAIKLPTIIISDIENPKNNRIILRLLSLRSSTKKATTAAATKTIELIPNINYNFGINHFISSWLGFGGLAHPFGGLNFGGMVSGNV